MAKSLLCVAALLALAALAAQAQPLKESGVEWVAKVQKRYTDVRISAEDQERQLLAAVDAGKLTRAQINTVYYGLQQDVTTASIINGKLLAGLSVCWFGPIYLVNACQITAATNCLGDVTTLESSHTAHTAIVQQLLS